jgi:hypothetical protein
MEIMHHFVSVAVYRNAINKSEDEVVTESSLKVA